MFEEPSLDLSESDLSDFRSTSAAHFDNQLYGILIPCHK